MKSTSAHSYGKPPFNVVVIHGGPGAAGEMAPVARRLSERFGVLEPVQTAASVEGQISELREVLLQRASVPSVLAGHSWGAWLSLLVAADSPKLVDKVIIVGCGPLTEAYVARLDASRMSRLEDHERQEFRAARSGLRDSQRRDKDELLAALGRLASKADSYAPVVPAGKARAVTVNGDIFSRVWPEAAEMRRTGELLRRVGRVACPVVAIHGDSDPHPAAGVSEVLSSVLQDFRLVLLAKCGHTPWLERYACDEFHKILISECASA